MRRLCGLVLVLALVVTAKAALAHSDTGNGTRPMAATDSKPAPLDPGYEPQFRPLVEGALHTGRVGGGKTGTSSWSLIPHSHAFLGVNRTYDGYDPEELLAGPQSCPAAGTQSCTLTYSQWRSWAHKYAVNIQFDVATLRTGVGYDVTYSSGSTVQNAVTYHPGYTAEIWRRQWYHVQEYRVKNTYCFSSTCWDEFGSGWAARWFKNQVDPRVYRS